MLLVEDDVMLGKAVRDGLRQDGYVVDWVTETRAALAALATTTFSALVLDLGLPKWDGSAVLRWLRAQGDPLPTVITTARDRIVERIAALDAGADVRRIAYSGIYCASIAYPDFIASSTSLRDVVRVGRLLRECDFARSKDGFWAGQRPLAADRPGIRYTFRGRH